MPKISEITDVAPIIERFEVINLNGYKNLALEAKHCVKIVAAENGTGKTTLLNALHGALTGKVKSLHALDFSQLKIKFHGYEEISVEKKDLFPVGIFKALNSSALEEIKSYDVSEGELFELMATLEDDDIAEIRETQAYKKIFTRSPLDNEETIALCSAAYEDFRESNSYSGFFSQVREIIKDTKVLYLPTFRRIEAEFSEYKNPKRNRRGLWNGLFDDTRPSPSYHRDKLIWFGMQDVEEVLESIKEKIKNTTFTAYSRISAQSLEDLISPYSRDPELIRKDDDGFREELGLVLARIGKADGQTAQRINELIESEAINADRYKSLRNHLSQLIEIYKQTKVYEQSIEGFVTAINKYWIASAEESNSAVEKEFVFDKLALDVYVENKITGKEIKLGNLSSGEKQVISIFAKLYMGSSNKYIVLIDEPELSLSLSWQKLFLPDVLESPACEQLIAITHSPFIFANQLDKYAGTLNIKYSKPEGAI
ncbi:AAA family ATPase [Pseudomonas aeruginosa]|nr:AAA family ATPase [Pseudomonas aeruginosa]HCF6212263.1 ATP-binding protein [Pseudomonas aeruginosa]HCT2624274.1 ATP-binding protein [Pseudomonas aeruginosa]